MGGRCSCHVAMVARSVGGGVGLVGLAAGGGCWDKAAKDDFIPPPPPPKFLLPHFGRDSIRDPFHCRSETELRTH